MGPILIFDKSLLESLNTDEAVWLDQFFLTNITPLFFIETLADLEKEVRTGRTPGQVVGSIAYRTPDMNARPNAHHRMLLQNELTGVARVPMGDGRSILSGGRPTTLGDRRGIFFSEAPEEEAFQRWQRREFLEVERTHARRWRDELRTTNLEKESSYVATLLEGLSLPKTLDEAKAITDGIVDRSDQSEAMILGLLLVGMSTVGIENVMDRWAALGRPEVRTFAPYFRHVFGVDLFFHIALAAGLIGVDRPSNKADIAYLYYLPFCMVGRCTVSLDTSLGDPSGS